MSERGEKVGDGGDKEEGGEEIGKVVEMGDR